MKTLTKEQIEKRDAVFAQIDKELPEPYAKLAKLRYDPAVWHGHKTNGETCVVYAFKWSDTPESNAFWDHVDDYCRGDRKDLPPIPESSLKELNMKIDIKHTTKAQLATELEAALNDVTKLHRQNEELREQVAMLKRTIEEGDNEEMKVADLEMQLGIEESNHADTRAELARTKEEIAKLSRKIETMKAMGEISDTIKNTFADAIVDRDESKRKLDAVRSLLLNASEANRALADLL